MLKLVLLTALLSALVVADDAVVRRQATDIVPIVTIETVTVTPGASTSTNALSVLSSANSASTTTASAAVEGKPGPGASGTGQTGTGSIGAGASTYTTTDQLGNTYMDVIPSSVHTVYASTTAPPSHVATVVVTITSSTAHPSSSSSPSPSSSSAFAAPTRVAGAMLGMAGLAGVLIAI